MQSRWKLPFLAIALVALGCSRDQEQRDLIPASLGDLMPALKEEQNNPPKQAIECEDLPALTPEELANPPYAPFTLEKSITRPGAPPPKYHTLPDVILAEPVAEKVAEIDEAYARRTGKHITVTSGTRDTTRQAKAMFKMLRLGGDPERLYRNKTAAREIKQAYNQNTGKPSDEIITAMIKVLDSQINRGIYISAHLRAGAVDIRNRDMSPSEKKAFLAATTEVKGISALEESTPPHFHLQID